MQVFHSASALTCPLPQRMMDSSFRHSELLFSEARFLGAVQSLSSLGRGGMLRLPSQIQMWPQGLKSMAKQYTSDHQSTWVYHQRNLQLRKGNEEKHVRRALPYFRGTNYKDTSGWNDPGSLPQQGPPSIAFPLHAQEGNWAAIFLNHPTCCRVGPKAWGYTLSKYFLRLFRDSLVME